MEIVVEVQQHVERPRVATVAATRSKESEPFQAVIPVIESDDKQ